MFKTLKTFESMDEVVTAYIFGVPSGEVIYLSEDELVSLKKERLIKYENKYRAFTFLDENKKSINKYLYKIPDRIDFVRNFMRHIEIDEDYYTLYENLSVDVFCDVDITQRGLTKIPVKFNLVEGDFNCSMNKLETLTNAPEIVYGYFDCSFNKIYTLIGGPKEVRDGYYCSDNKLEDLEGFPGRCKIVFDCSNNNIKTLKGCPEIIHFNDFDVSRNKLKDLKNGPKEVKNFDCSYNQITTLGGGIVNANKFNCNNNRLIDLLGMPTNTKIYFREGNKIDEIQYD